MATVTEAYCISEGSGKETNHYVISLRGSGINYKPGDSLGFYPTNDKELVKQTVRKINARRKDLINTKETGETTLENALLHRFTIHRAGKKLLSAVVQRMNKGKEKNDLEKILDNREEVDKYLFTRDCIDILNENDVHFTPQEFVDTLSPITPRLYSISSSPKAHPREVHLTIAIVKYNNFERDRFGLATGHLCNQINVNETKIPIYIQPTKEFVLPKNGSTDIIMIGPGTGIAPFRAFLEHRIAEHAHGRNWLFFGDQSEKTEFYYKDQIETWLDEGNLYRFTTAWSRDQEEKIYVQHRLKEYGAEVWQWFENGAYFYICGDKQYMAKDVHRTLIEIAMEHGGMNEEDATFFIEKTMMREQKRYLRDVY